MEASGVAGASSSKAKSHVHRTWLYATGTGVCSLERRGCALERRGYVVSVAQTQKATCPVQSTHFRARAGCAPSTSDRPDPDCGSPPRLSGLFPLLGQWCQGHTLRVERSPEGRVGFDLPESSRYPSDLVYQGVELIIRQVSAGSPEPGREVLHQAIVPFPVRVVGAASRVLPRDCAHGNVRRPLQHQGLPRRERVSCALTALCQLRGGGQVLPDSWGRVARLPGTNAPRTSCRRA